MAQKRHGRRRRRSKGRFVAIPFSATLPVLAVNAGVVVKANLFGSNFAEDFYAISVDASWGMEAHTAGEGPYTLGYAHGDLSEAEIVESITAELTDPGDIIQKERARRPVRSVGRFTGVAIDEVLNDGVLIRTPLKFAVNDGNQVVFWMFNRDSVQQTTGTLIKVDGVLYGRWQI